jgi:uncharacterized protein
MDSVVHFEIPFEDKDRAKKFYADTFGWTFQDSGVEMNGDQYTTIMTCEVDEETQRPKEIGKMNGGFVPKNMVNTPVVVMNVKDIEKAIAQVEANGGTGGDVFPVGTFGLYAYVTDSEKNRIGIWQDIKQEAKDES